MSRPPGTPRDFTPGVARRLIRGVVRRQDPVGRHGGRQLAREHRLPDLVTDCPDLGRAAQSLLELVAHQCPGEVELLTRPLVGQAPVPEVGAMSEHALPQVVDPDVVERRAGHDRRRPLPVPAHQAQRPGELAGRGLRLLLAVAVGLVDRDHVRDLEDALLDALELVAGAGQRQEQERVDHPRDGDLGLADAHGLDQHDVVRRRLEHRHRLDRRPGDAAERAGGRRRADVGVRVGGQPGHPGLVAENRTAGPHARRVHREHPDPVALSGQARAERLDERGLPDARDAGDADPDGRRVNTGALGIRQCGQQLPGRGAVFGLGRLDQGDRLRDRGAPLRADALDELVDVRHRGRAAPAAWPAGPARTRR